MKETSIGIRGLVKWLRHNALLIICLTVAAALVITAFYMLKYFSSEKAEATTAVSGKIFVISENTAECTELFDSYYAAAFGLMGDEGIKNKALNLSADAGIDTKTAEAVYNSFTFSYINYGVIPFTYSVSSSRSQEAEAAVDIYLSAVEDSLSGFPEGLSLRTDKSTIVTKTTSAPNSVAGYLLSNKKKLSVGVLAAFVLICGVYSVIYMLMTRVRDVNDLESRYDVPVLSTVTKKKKDSRNDYKSLLIMLEKTKRENVRFIVGQSREFPVRLSAALKDAAVLVYDDSAAETEKEITSPGLHYVDLSFDAESLKDDFKVIVPYIVRSKDRSFALGLLAKADSCIFAETQYKSSFVAIEDSIRDMQSISVDVEGFVLEEY